MIMRTVLFVATTWAASLAYAGFVGIDFGPGDQSPENWNPVWKNGNHQNLIDDEGRSTVVSLYVRNAGTPFAVTPNPTSVPQYRGNLAAIDGNQYQFGGTFQAQFTGLKPLEPYDLYVFGLRGGAGTKQAVALGGGRGVTVSQSAPDGVLVINDQVGSNQRPLSGFAQRLTSSGQGTIDVVVTGGNRPDQTFAVAGLAIQGEFPGGSVHQPGGAAGGPSPDPSPGASSGHSRAAGSTPPGPDVVGVYMGMALDEARTVINRQYPEISLTMFQWSLSQVQKSRIHGGPRYDAGFQGSYVASGRNDSFIVMGHMPPGNGRVAGIGRHTYVGEMLLSDLRASLVEKYGKPHLEIQPNTTLRKPYLILSWSLARDGTPLTDPAAAIGCIYFQQSGNPWEGAVPVTLWDTKEAYYGQFDQCGFTLAALTNVHNPAGPTISAFGMVMHDFNEIRKSAKAAWEETDRIAIQLEEDKKRELAGKKPRL